MSSNVTPPYVGYVTLSRRAGAVFPDVRLGDMVMFTCNTDQRILVGAGVDTPSAMVIENRGGGATVVAVNGTLYAASYSNLIDSYSNTGAQSTLVPPTAAALERLFVYASNIAADNQTANSAGIFASNLWPDLYFASNVAFYASNQSTRAAALETSASFSSNAVVEAGATAHAALSYARGLGALEGGGASLYLPHCNVTLGGTLHMTGDIDIGGGLLTRNGTPVVLSQWSNVAGGRSVYVLGCNVGVGTAEPLERLHVAGGNVIVDGVLSAVGGVTSGGMTRVGDVVPRGLPGNTAFDFGTSNSRFRDIYLCGSVDFGGSTRISRDPLTDGLRVVDQRMKLLPIAASRVQIGNPDARLSSAVPDSVAADPGVPGGTIVCLPQEAMWFGSDANATMRVYVDTHDAATASAGPYPVSADADPAGSGTVAVALPFELRQGPAVAPMQVIIAKDRRTATGWVRAAAAAFVVPAGVAAGTFVVTVRASDDASVVPGVLLSGVHVTDVRGTWGGGISAARILAACFASVRGASLRAYADAGARLVWDQDMPHDVPVCGLMGLTSALFDEVAWVSPYLPHLPPGARPLGLSVDAKIMRAVWMAGAVCDTLAVYDGAAGNPVLETLEVPPGRGAATSLVAVDALSGDVVWRSHMFTDAIPGRPACVFTEGGTAVTALTVCAGGSGASPVVLDATGQPIPPAYLPGYQGQGAVYVIRLRSVDGTAPPYVAPFSRIESDSGFVAESTCTALPPAVSDGVLVAVASPPTVTGAVHTRMHWGVVDRSISLPSASGGAAMLVKLASVAGSVQLPGWVITAESLEPGGGIPGTLAAPAAGTWAADGTARIFLTLSTSAVLRLTDTAHEIRDMPLNGKAAVIQSFGPAGQFHTTDLLATADMARRALARTADTNVHVAKTGDVMTGSLHVQSGDITVADGRVDAAGGIIRGVLEVAGGSGTSGYVRIAGPNSDLLQAGVVDTIDSPVSITRNGHVGVLTDAPLYPLHISGQVNNIGLFVEGDIAALSDARMKTDVEPIDSALDRLDRMRGYTFVRTGGAVRRRMAGVIAQEAVQALPEVVAETANGTLNVCYNGITALLVQAVRELREELRALCSQSEQRP